MCTLLWSSSILCCSDIVFLSSRAVCVCVVVQTEKKMMKMNEEIKKSLSLDNAVSTLTS